MFPQRNGETEEMPQQCHSLSVKAASTYFNLLTFHNKQQRLVLEVSGFFLTLIANVIQNI